MVSSDTTISALQRTWALEKQRDLAAEAIKTVEAAWSRSDVAFMAPMLHLGRLLSASTAQAWATPLCFSNGEAVPHSNKCKYLGTQVSWEDPTKTATNHRLQLAKAAYSKLAPFWRSRVPLSVKLRVFESNITSVATYSLAILTLEDKHLRPIDSWYFNYLRRVVGIKASYYSRISNRTVWIKANKPVIPSQELMAYQFKLLTPTDDPCHHVMFAPGYPDRVGIQRNSKRGPPPPHWLGLTSQRALTFFAQDVTSQPGYSSHTRVDLLGLKKYITKHPEYPARLAAAPTRSAETFN